MRMLLGLASLVAIALPSSVNAQSTIVTQGFSASSGSGRIQRDDFRRGEPRLQGCDRRGGRGDGDRRGRRNSCEISTGTWVDGGEWALYNNRSFESDSYNDWWHDRPDRAYPRWMSNNQDCQRQYWTGNGWRC